MSRLFHGPVLTSGSISDAEQYTYSAVWLLYGVALLAAGIWYRSLPLRIASAAVIVLTVLKVFLIDMSDLTGIYRALSFLGLGAVLIGIGWFYQRLLFPVARPDFRGKPGMTGAGAEIMVRCSHRSGRITNPQEQNVKISHGLGLSPIGGPV